MRFTEHSNTLSAETAQEARRLIQESSNLEELIRGWGSLKEREIKFCCGYDDDDRHASMWVMLRQRGDTQQESGEPRTDARLEGYIMLEELYALYPAAKPFSDFTTCSNKQNAERIIVDEERLKAYLQYDPREFFNDELCSPLVKLDRSISLILAYALSDGGDVLISFDPCPYEEIDFDRVGCRMFGWVGLGYQSPTPVNGVLPGLGENIYIDLTC